MNAPTKIAPTFHQVLIECLCETFPEVRTRGFFRALKTLPDAEYVPDLLTEDDESAWINRVRFVPDAYAIDEQSRTVTIFEAVDKHDVPAHKMGKMTDLAWALDEDYYNLALVRLTLAGATAYDVLAMSLCFMFDKARGVDKKPEQSWLYYTQDVTNRRLLEGPPVRSESIEAMYDKIAARINHPGRYPVMKEM